MKRVCIILFALMPLYVSAKELSTKIRNTVDSLMHAGLVAGYYPGGAVAIGNSKGVLFEKCYGYRDAATTEEVTPDDVYDIASVTKVISTTFAVMKLYDEQLLDVNKTVGDYVEYYDGSPVDKITLTELLTHTSGLPYFPAYSLLFSNGDGGALISTKQHAELYPYAVDKGCYLCANPVGNSRYVSMERVEGYRRAAESLYICPDVDSIVIARIIRSYKPASRGKYDYSDTNFLILRQIIESLTGQTLDKYVAGLFAELQMVNTGYLPLTWKTKDNIIPTEFDRLMQRGQIRGYAHDDLAAINGNVEGNAGLFSNTSDLSRFCQMMLNEGIYRGKRIISERTVRLFTSSPLQPKGIFRGLGFDKRGTSSTLHGGYGHTGYTGTMIWMDRQRDIFMVFLSNRVCPTRLNNGLNDSGLRVKIWNAVRNSQS